MAPPIRFGGALWRESAPHGHERGRRRAPWARGAAWIGNALAVLYVVVLVRVGALLAGTTGDTAPGWALCWWVVGVLLFRTFARAHEKYGDR